MKTLMRTFQVLVLCKGKGLLQVAEQKDLTDTSVLAGAAIRPLLETAKIFYSQCQILRRFLKSPSALTRLLPPVASRSWWDDGAGKLKCCFSGGDCAHGASKGNCRPFHHSS
ncbi:unnamed protein product [Durusdinium trenchii]|uniref:Uncharacterized protein n=1 Tax=Durusdinium trenchii TaxID=1381693 RepID=A0ABP0JFU2_9DINO